ncbi:hypothetical protein [Phenylobacterium sp.]|uniref:hypothetical protein n=1 Tax=Phenylobacterium sp. TaxID=1871053 RepID=UPI00121AB8C4|nr:hypothetical protein [Phenylobacterium sp.]THD67140.1 MAG: hypothetical protein E8A12_05570 [Phenylobacterium sp.]
MRLAASILAAALASSAAAAAPPAVAPGPPPPPATVSPLTVFPRSEAPKLVKSYPAAGAAIAPGLLVLSVTFDQSMLQTGFDVTSSAGAEPLPCLKTARLLDDRKTFVLLCTAEPGKTYKLALNAGAQGGFQNESEHRALPAGFSFTTTTDVNGPGDIHTALKASGLRDIDMPIQDTPDRRGEKPGA